MEKSKLSTSRSFNLVLVAGGIGAAVMTWMAPPVIKLLFTPPVSFGVNCEAAASWSMRKLVISQFVGVLAGFVGGWIAAKALRRRLDRSEPAAQIASPQG